MIYFQNIADLEEAKLRYRALAKELHPDKGGHVLQFQQMQEEYKTLLLQLQSKQAATATENQTSDIVVELRKLASLLITTKLIECKKEIPLLSFKDPRILIVTQICTTQIEMEQKIRQMQKRHIKRKADIDWNYNKQKLEKSTKFKFVK